MEASVPEGSSPGSDPQQHLRVTTGLLGQYYRADLKSPHEASSEPGQLQSALPAGASPGQPRAGLRPGRRGALCFSRLEDKLLNFCHHRDVFLFYHHSSNTVLETENI